MLDAGMQARGKAHIARVVGRPKHSFRVVWISLALVLVSGGVSYYFWQSAPGHDQLGRLTVLSACDERTPGQAWLEARSAVGADGVALTASQRRAAMDYLLSSNAASGCESPGGQNDEGEALAFSEGE